MSSVLEARGLGRELPGPPPVTLVADVTLPVQAGRFTTIIGPSGCGKSSLLYLLGMLDRPTSGSLLVDGMDVDPLDGDERAALRLASFGFVFQFHFLLPEFTALQNVLLPMLRLGKLDAAEAEERAHALLASMDLAGREDSTPEKLSGGERQRVAIARALANSPKLILADEPTGNLDSKNSDRVLEIMRSLAHDEGRSVVCVTHDLNIAAQSDVRVAMLDGRIASVD
ncbi:ABC transporter ATP-binding protein [Sphingomonas sp. KRR8]|uniref:ABC transporter ATP-binding protein n=1 Tax=Sphingomonas sp. KRR8 TaxID=2942996 RepID=UPI002021D31D|nr:ABC transporter ATP-binding protein [Sphingomonas sp. KRR8]URD59890.1 ABC transporter ATP-binding protein [Sphingomonas sp. KRR8]